MNEKRHVFGCWWCIGQERGILYRLAHGGGVLRRLFMDFCSYAVFGWRNTGNLLEEKSGMVTDGFHSTTTVRSCFFGTRILISP